MNNFATRRVVINKEVSVPEVFFRQERVDRPIAPRDRRPLRSYPRRMEHQGREYTFVDGLRYLVRQGQRLVQVFDMTDGAHDYRLNFDMRSNSWTLVDMSL